MARVNLTLSANRSVSSTKSRERFWTQAPGECGEGNVTIGAQLVAMARRTRDRGNRIRKPVIVRSHRLRHTRGAIPAAGSSIALHDEAHISGAKCHIFPTTLGTVGELGYAQ